MPGFLQPLAGLPWWLTLVILIPLGLYLLLLLAVPFSVFGVKSRLESIEARLDGLHEEIRSLALRAGPEAVSEQGRARSNARPPIAPDPLPVETDFPRLQPDSPARRPRDEKPARAEPRLDWPR